MRPHHVFLGVLFKYRFGYVLDVFLGVYEGAKKRILCAGDFSMDNL